MTLADLLEAALLPTAPPAETAELAALKEAARAWAKNNDDIEAGEDDFGKLEDADSNLWEAARDWARAEREAAGD